MASDRPPTPSNEQRAVRDVDLDAWARLFDEPPSQIQRAIGQTGTDLGAVRRFLFDRQLGLDFDGSAAEVAAQAGASPGS